MVVFQSKQIIPLQNINYTFQFSATNDLMPVFVGGWAGGGGGVNS